MSADAEMVPFQGMPEPKRVKALEAFYRGSSRWTPCADHRDKVDYREACPQCAIERLQAKLADSADTIAALRKDAEDREREIAAALELVLACTGSACLSGEKQSDAKRRTDLRLVREMLLSVIGHLTPEPRRVDAAAQSTDKCEHGRVGRDCNVCNYMP